VTAEEVKQIRGRLGWSAHVLAKVLGAAVRTVEDWERGIARVPGPAAFALELLDELRRRKIPVSALERGDQLQADRAARRRGIVKDPGSGALH
jgi:transcriptional regulator with XRE-family HTH domain